jgi:hypothetical protein
MLGENVTPSVNNSTSQGQNPPSGTPGESTNNKWFSVSARRAGAAGTAYPGDRGGSTRGGAYSGRGSDMRKQGSFIFLNKIQFLFFFFYLIKFR